MTNEEAIKNIKELLKWYLKEEPMSETVYKREAVEIAIKALEQQPAWIPVSDPLNELPKDRTLYVTTKFGDVETLVWDMTEWDDADVARCTIAYMDYYVPQPYKAESEE